MMNLESLGYSNLSEAKLPYMTFFFNPVFISNRVSIIFSVVRVLMTKCKSKVGIVSQVINLREQEQKKNRTFQFTSNSTYDSVADPVKLDC